MKNSVPFEVRDRLTRFMLKPEQVRTHPTPQTRSVCPILTSLSAQEQGKNTQPFLKNRQRAPRFESRRKGELFALLPNTSKSAFAQRLCSLQLSVVRCNAWVSLKRRKSSQGKCLLMRFRYCFIAVSSLTSSLTVPLHTQGSLYLQEFLRLKYQNSAKHKSSVPTKRQAPLCD